jgi:hypothetical protein
MQRRFVFVSAARLPLHPGADEKNPQQGNAQSGRLCGEMPMRGPDILQHK